IQVDRGTVRVNRPTLTSGIHDLDGDDRASDPLIGCGVGRRRTLRLSEFPGLEFRLRDRRLRFLNLRWVLGHSRRFESENMGEPGKAASEQKSRARQKKYEQNEGARAASFRGATGSPRGIVGLWPLQLVVGHLGLWLCPGEYTKSAHKYAPKSPQSHRVASASLRPGPMV